MLFSIYLSTFLDVWRCLPFSKLPSTLFYLGSTISLFLFSQLPLLFNQTMFFLSSSFLFTNWFVLHCHSSYPVHLHSPHMSISISLYFLLNCLTNFHCSFDHFMFDSVSFEISQDLLSALISTAAIYLFSFSVILHSSHSYVRILFTMVLYRVAQIKLLQLRGLYRS